jgi:hypothetical protein
VRAALSVAGGQVRFNFGCSRCRFRVSARFFVDFVIKRAEKRKARRETKSAPRQTRFWPAAPTAESVAGPGSPRLDRSPAGLSLAAPSRAAPSRGRSLTGRTPSGYTFTDRAIDQRCPE